MKLTVQQGRRGRWRWLLREGDVLVCVSPVRGHDSKQEATDAALNALETVKDMWPSRRWFEGADSYSRRLLRAFATDALYCAEVEDDED